MKKIALAGDHAGYEYKAEIKKMLEKSGYQVIDFGTDSSESVDYPDFVHPAAQAVASGDCDAGILFCGSGNGVQMTANKHQKIRCALCWQVELAELCRQHNDCNMMAVPCRFVSKDLCEEMVNAFLSTAFEAGRHQNRVDKISC